MAPHDDRADLEQRVARLEGLERLLSEASQERQASDERFRKIFDHSNDAIFVVDGESQRIVEANRRACRMLGYARDELVGMSPGAIHPHEVERFQRFTGVVMEDGAGWTDELSCMTKTGVTVPSEISASLVNVRGRTQLIALVRDISERKKIEVALRRQSEQLEELVRRRTSQLEASQERLRTLLEITNAVVTHLEPEPLVEAVAESVARVLAFDRLTVSLWHPERDEIRILAVSGDPELRATVPAGTVLPTSATGLDEVVRHGRARRIDDLSAGPAATGPAEPLSRSGIRSAVSVPLRSKGRILGALSVGLRTPAAYGDEDAKRLSEVAEQVAPAVDNMLAYQEIERLRGRLEQEKLYLEEEIETEHQFDEFIGSSAEVGKVLKAVRTVAATEATVLVTGETGTGKGLVARLVHSLSARSDKTLVKVNCAALPAELIESELFGHEKGAFTGASALRVGRFELADGGTLFLDEIGELPTPLQSKLLAVLQEGEFQRVGGSKTRTVDVRVIAATNRDLATAVREGRFRSDLFYRLNVFPIEVPPLRERPDDVAPLVRHFALKYGTKLGKRIETIPTETLTELRAYPWPGNVRELENVIERAVILSVGPQLEVGDWRPKREGDLLGEGGNATLDEVQRRHILAVLERTGWRVSGRGGAAEILDVKPTTLESRMKKLGIRRP